MGFGFVGFKESVRVSLNFWMGTENGLQEVKWFFPYFSQSWCIDCYNLNNKSETQVNFYIKFQIFFSGSFHLRQSIHRKRRRLSRTHLPFASHDAGKASNVVGSSSNVARFLSGRWPPEDPNDCVSEAWTSSASGHKRKGKLSCLTTLQNCLFNHNLKKAFSKLSDRDTLFKLLTLIWIYKNRKL